MLLDWIKSPAGLLARIAVGVVVFAVLAIVDLRRNGPAATRWREYGVLLAAVGAALLYGVVNDQITVTISPEYFLYFKDLATKPGPLRWEAAKVGLMATWSPGLVFGVAILLANNPWRAVPRLRNRQLLWCLPVILFTAAALGIIGGVIGYLGGFTHWSADFEQIAREPQWRPRRFMACWGVHLGGYAGGLIGTAIAVTAVVRRRMYTGRRQLTVCREFHARS